ncbi:MAG: class I SAM-dependent RNA methyltransferase [Elusimicrobiota bacterium]|jgi:putative N6-adenine-specific DNA methylase
MDTFLALCASGLEELAAEELRELGLRKAGAPSPEPGAAAVAFGAPLEAVFQANLRLHCVDRVVVLVGKFHASSFAELHQKAGGLRWERFLKPGRPLSINVDCAGSRLYHEQAVAERIALAVEARLRKPSPVRRRKDKAAEEPLQLVVVRVQDDLCSVWIDSSGESLSRRGYRLETAKAPLKETLASAVLLASGWDRTSPFLDPFCGSGTIAIEAALLARRVPPGLNRRFAFMDWPGFDAKAWESLLIEERGHIRTTGPVIKASDRDAGAIEAARANAARAGMADAIEFSVKPVSAVEPPPGPGWIATNPPYGIRLEGAKDLRDLYAAFGGLLWRKFPGWKVSLLCPYPELVRATGLKFEASLETMNGGLGVTLFRRSI